MMKRCFKKYQLGQSSYSKLTEMNSLFSVTLRYIKVCGLVYKLRLLLFKVFVSNSDALGCHQELKEIHVHLGKCVFFYGYLMKKLY